MLNTLHGSKNYVLYRIADGTANIMTSDPDLVTSISVHLVSDLNLVTSISIVLVSKDHHSEWTISSLI